MSDAEAARKDIFGVVDVSHDRHTVFEEFAIRLIMPLLSPNHRFAHWLVLVGTECRRCGESKSKKFDSIEPVQLIRSWAQQPCNDCVQMTEEKIQVLKKVIAVEDARRDEVSRIIADTTGCSPTFKDSGTMTHPDIIVVDHYGSWVPTWIPQDGSTFALDRLHFLALALEVDTSIYDGMIVLPAIKTKSRWARDGIENEIKRIQDHLDKVEVYQNQAKSAAPSS